MVLTALRSFSSDACDFWITSTTSDIFSNERPWAEGVSPSILLLLTNLRSARNKVERKMEELEPNDSFLYRLHLEYKWSSSLILTL